ncbi:MAG: hypothetical protein AAFQ45_03140 [Pseudomonadota bacterium]
MSSVGTSIDERRREAVSPWTAAILIRRAVLGIVGLTAFIAASAWLLHTTI